MKKIEFFPQNVVNKSDGTWASSYWIYASFFAILVFYDFAFFSVVKYTKILITFVASKKI